MACSICGRSACMPAFHSTAEQTSLGATADEVQDGLRDELENALQATKELRRELDERRSACVDAEERILALKAELAKLREAVLALKELLGPSGEFSVCRSDRVDMGFPDMMLIGGAFERLDRALGIPYPPPAQNESGPLPEVKE